MRRRVERVSLLRMIDIALHGIEMTKFLRHQGQLMKIDNIQSGILEDEGKLATRAYMMNKISISIL